MRIFNKNPKNNPIIGFIYYALFLGIIVTTLISVISSFRGNIFLELLSPFKFQYFLLNLLIFGLLLLTRHKKIIVISLFCLSLVIVEIAPWYIPQTGIEINHPAKLRVLSSNVNVENQKYPQVLSLVRREKPDIAVFMEIHQDWVKQLDTLKDILPYSIVQANPYNLGIALYSNRPLEEASITFLGTTQNPSIVGKLNINGQIVSLVAAHPPPPIKSSLFKARNQQLEAISKYIKSLSTKVIMTGDL
ncbi:MAG TPA: endonuclease/exonuclease/phosphatase family protein, partial [Stenomitos sp.]